MGGLVPVDFTHIVNEIIVLIVRAQELAKQVLAKRVMAMADVPPHHKQKFIEIATERVGASLDPEIWRHDLADSIRHLQRDMNVEDGIEFTNADYRARRALRKIATTIDTLFVVKHRKRPGRKSGESEYKAYLAWESTKPLDAGEMDSFYDSLLDLYDLTAGFRPLPQVGDEVVSELPALPDHVAALSSVNLPPCDAIPTAAWGKITRQLRRVFVCLWESESVDIDGLIRRAWNGKAIKPKTVTEAASDLEEVCIGLADQGYEFFEHLRFERGGGLVWMTHPDKPKPASHATD